MVAGADKRRLTLEIDGPGVTPSTLDPLATLELGRAYLRLLKRVAADKGVELELKGLEVQDKCAALVFDATNPKLAEAVAFDAHQIMHGKQLVPRGLGSAMDELASAVRALPPEQTVKVLVGKRKLRVVREPVRSASRSSETKLRVTLVAVGGNEPTARMSSDSEERVFSVRVHDVATAQKLGALVYTQMDVDLQLERDAQGLIVGGKLLAFSPMKKGPALEHWREWFARVGAAEWGEVEDIEKELGRMNETQDV